MSLCLGICLWEPICVRKPMEVRTPLQSEDIFGAVGVLTSLADKCESKCVCVCVRMIQRERERCKTDLSIEAILWYVVSCATCALLVILLSLSTELIRVFSAVPCYWSHVQPKYRTSDKYFVLYTISIDIYGCILPLIVLLTCISVCELNKL